MAGARAAALFALWLLLVDATDTPNLVAGGVCALLATALAVRAASLRRVHPRPRLAMFRFAYRPLLQLPTDSVRVTGALIARALLRRPVTGHWRAVRYRATGEAPDQVARRILTKWGASAAPNRYVIGIDPDQDVLLVHELVWSSGPLDPLELGR